MRMGQCQQPRDGIAEGSVEGAVLGVPVRLDEGSCARHCTRGHTLLSRRSVGLLGHRTHARTGVWNGTLLCVFVGPFIEAICRLVCWRRDDAIIATTKSSFDTLFRTCNTQHQRMHQQDTVTNEDVVSVCTEPDLFAISCMSKHCTAVRTCHYFVTTVK